MCLTENCSNIVKMVCFLFQFLANREKCTTEAIEKIMQTYFAKDYAKRRDSHKEEVDDLARYVYWFGLVCTAGWL